MESLQPSPRIALYIRKFANAISWSGKGTPKKCVNSRHCLTTKQRKTIYGVKFTYSFQKVSRRRNMA